MDHLPVSTTFAAAANQRATSVVSSGSVAAPPRGHPRTEDIASPSHAKKRHRDAKGRLRLWRCPQLRWKRFPSGNSAFTLLGVWDIRFLQKWEEVVPLSF